MEIPLFHLTLEVESIKIYSRDDLFSEIQYLMYEFLSQGFNSQSRHAFVTQLSKIIINNAIKRDTPNPRLEVVHITFHHDTTASVLLQYTQGKTYVVRVLEDGVHIRRSAAIVEPIYAQINTCTSKIGRGLAIKPPPSVKVEAIQAETSEQVCINTPTQTSVVEGDVISDYPLKQNEHLVIEPDVLVIHAEETLSDISDKTSEPGTPNASVSRDTTLETHVCDGRQESSSTPKDDALSSDIDQGYSLVARKKKRSNLSRVPTQSKTKPDTYKCIGWTKVPYQHFQVKRAVEARIYYKQRFGKGALRISTEHVDPESLRDDRYYDHRRYDFPLHTIRVPNLGLTLKQYKSLELLPVRRGTYPLPYKEEVWSTD
jgi:hypothetical protein